MSNKLLHLLEDIIAGAVAVLIGIYACLAVARAYPAMEPLSDVRMGADADAGSLPRVERVATAPTTRLPEAPPDTSSVTEETPSTQEEDRDGWTYLGSYYVTGYDTCAACCGKTDGITASGTTATVGRTCAANGLPFGTRLWIEGIGERTVEDRGGMKGRHIDVLCADHPDCYAVTGWYEVYVYE